MEVSYLSLDSILMIVLIIVLVIMLLMFGFLFGALKNFLLEEIQEAIIASGECTEDVGEEVKKFDEALNAIRRENQDMRMEIMQSLAKIINAISQSDGKAEHESSNILKELREIVPALHTEISNMLKTLSEGSGKFQDESMRNIEAEVKKLSDAINAAVNNLNKASQAQSERLATVAGAVQTVLDKGVKDLQNEFNKTDSELKKITKDAVKRINDDYQNNMKKMFQAMADNLAAITRKLSSASEREKRPSPPAAHSVKFDNSGQGHIPYEKGK